MRRFRYFVLLAVLFVFIEDAAWSEEAKTNNRVSEFTYKVIAVHPHDPGAFTQGLAIEKGVLYEGTGLYTRSSLRRVEIQTGKVLQQHRLPLSLFGEGITVIGDRIIQLTWKSRFGFVYDRNTFKLLRVFNYPGEGWGITYDGSSLIMSDGTSMIRFLNPETFEEIRRIEVVDGQRPVTYLNELEYVKGSIYANVWKSNRIAIINPLSGKVSGWLDLEKLHSEVQNTGKRIDVLNGIAFDPENDALYVTGKLWPRLYRIEPVLRTEKK